MRIRRLHLASFLAGALLIAIGIVATKYFRALPDGVSPAQPSASSQPYIPRIETRPSPTPAPLDSSPPTFPTPKPDSVARSLQESKMTREQWLAAARDPVVLHRLADDARRLTLDRYATLLEHINLSDPQLNEFIKRLNDRRQAIMDVAVVSVENGVNPSDDLEAFHARVDAARSKIDGEIRALLGEGEYEKYQAYNASTSVEATFTRLDRTIGGTENALQPDQKARLAVLLKADGTGNLSPAVIAGARDFLSAAQVNALEEAFSAQQAIIERRFNQALPPASVFQK